MIGGVSKDINFRVSAETGHAIRAFKGLNQEATRTTQTVGRRMPEGTRQAGFAMLNFNRIAQDSIYFTNSLNMGVMAISNNLPIFIESMHSAKNAAGGWRGAMKNLASQFITLPNLLMLGVTAISAWALYASQAKKETKELKKETDGLKSAFSALFSISSPMDLLKVSADASGLKALRERAKQRLADNIIASPKTFSQSDTEGIRENFKALVDNQGALEQQKKSLEALIEFLDPIIEKYDNFTEGLKLVNELGLKPVNEELQKLLERARKVKAEAIEFRDYFGRKTTVETTNTLALFDENGNRKTMPVGSAGSKYKNPAAVATKTLGLELKQVQNYAQMAGTAMTSAFLSGANAAQALLNTLISIAAQLAVMGLVKWIFNPVGALTSSLGDTITSLGTDSAGFEDFSLGKSSTRVVINLDGRMIAEATTPYQSQSMARNRRLRR